MMIEIEEIRILVIEDEKPIADILEYGFKKEGFRVKSAYTGADGLSGAEEFEPNLVLLDWMLPDLSGVDVCKMLTEMYNIPIIMLTARGSIDDKVYGLESGADDYITKPFNPLELVARVKAVLRRYQMMSQAPDTKTADQHGNFVEYPDLIVNLTNYSVIYNGHSVEMPPKELELLYFLASSPNQVFTREQLLDQIWGYEYIGDTRTVDVHIKRLREKIKDHGSWSLSTVWGIGYKFEVK